jgi:hypothetical protein
MGGRKQRQKASTDHESELRALQERAQDLADRIRPPSGPGHVQPRGSFQSHMNRELPVSPPDPRVATLVTELDRVVGEIENYLESTNV